MRSRRRALAVSVTALALSLAACSSAGKTVTGSAVGSPSAPPTVTSFPSGSPASSATVPSLPATSSAPAPSSSAPSSATSGAAAALMAKLLTAGELGGGFTQIAYDGKDNTSPCDPKGTPGIDEQVPPTLKVGRDFVLNSANAQFEEDLLTYADAGTATKALAATKAGLNCTTGNLYERNGTAIKVKISAATSLPAEGAVQSGAAWGITGTTIEGFAVIVKYSDTHLALITLFAPTGTPDSALPNVQNVIANAVKKFLS